MGVKLGRELRGYTRFRFLSELLAREGFAVDLITSSFQHWDKAQRNVDDPSYRGLPYRVVFIDEPGYKKNLDVKRILSHRTAAKNLAAHFKRAFAADSRAYDLIYAEIPPNDVARAAAEAACAHQIPFVADINDLWPEAMRMVFDVPVLSTLALCPFARDARRTYELLDAAVGTSDEYAARPAKDRAKPYRRLTVYVGNDLAAFDRGAEERAVDVEKPAGEIWAVYAGTLGASYDIATLVRAGAQLEAARRRAGSAQAARAGAIRVKILGDGPDRASLEALARKLNAPVDFIGYAPYDLMAAYLVASDMTVNSLVETAPQSIVTKIGDYLASENPLINTGASQEFRRKVDADGFGLNVKPGDPDELARAIVYLACHPGRRAIMAARARLIAETEFDQAHSYQAIVNLVRNLT